jgi:hypothetical protein
MGASGTEFLSGKEYGDFAHDGLGSFWCFFDEKAKDEAQLRTMFG